MGTGLPVSVFSGGNEAGKVGRRRGGRQDEVVWNEFASDRESCRRTRCNLATLVQQGKLTLNQVLPNLTRLALLPSWLTLRYHRDFDLERSTT